MWITPASLIFTGFQAPQTTQKKSPNYKSIKLFIIYIYPPKLSKRIFYNSHILSIGF